MKFHHMTWQEIAAVDYDSTLVLLPVGSTEQHGHHLPTDTDTFLVEQMANAAERQLADRILLCPTLWLGHSPHHQNIGGTLSVHNRVYADMIKSLAESCLKLGARNIWFLNGHGGNSNPLGFALQEIKDAYPEALVTSTTYPALVVKELQRLRESEFGGMGHACEFETSLYLYLAEERVRKERIIDDGNVPHAMFKGDLTEGPVSQRIYNFDEITASGVYGKATMATREKGERFFNVCVGAIVDFVEKLLHSAKTEGRKS